MSGSDQAPDLACMPSAITASERAAHFDLARELMQIRAEERIAIANGYALRFAPDSLESIARFIANERKCCPFVTFQLELKSGGGPLWLRMTGPKGAAQVLEAELGMVSACGCVGGCQ